MTKVEEDGFLAMFSFKAGELVENLTSHLDPATGGPCSGQSGIVKDVTGNGQFAYGECDTCHDILKEEI